MQQQQQQQQYVNRAAWQTHGKQQQQQQHSSGQAAAAGSNGSSSSGVLPCPVLYPWCDGRQDLQLSLMLMLMSSCSSEAGSFAEYGLEAVTQQVGLEVPECSLVFSLSGQQVVMCVMQQCALLSQARTP
jgi:hypothetical protein